jgi:hypothetical protein
VQYDFVCLEPHLPRLKLEGRNDAYSNTHLQPLNFLSSFDTTYLQVTKHEYRLPPNSYIKFVACSLTVNYAVYNIHLFRPSSVHRRFEMTREKEHFCMDRFRASANALIREVPRIIRYNI